MKRDILLNFDYKAVMLIGPSGSGKSRLCNDCGYDDLEVFSSFDVYEKVRYVRSRMKKIHKGDTPFVFGAADLNPLNLTDPEVLWCFLLTKNDVLSERCRVPAEYFRSSRYFLHRYGGYTSPHLEVHTDLYDYNTFCDNLYAFLESMRFGESFAPRLLLSHEAHNSYGEIDYDEKVEYFSILDPSSLAVAFDKVAALDIEDWQNAEETWSIEGPFKHNLLTSAFLAEASSFLEKGNLKFLQDRYHTDWSQPVLV